MSFNLNALTSLLPQPHPAFKTGSVAGGNDYSGNVPMQVNPGDPYGAIRDITGTYSPVGTPRIIGFVNNEPDQAIAIATGGFASP